MTPEEILDKVGDRSASGGSSEVRGARRVLVVPVAVAIGGAAGAPGARTVTGVAAASAAWSVASVSTRSRTAGPLRPRRRHHRAAALGVLLAGLVLRTGARRRVRH